MFICFTAKGMVFLNVYLICAGGLGHLPYLAGASGTQTVEV